jgi:signal transduction histidine kinase/tetratricopeptide (TPR) repeat protein
MTRIVTLLTFVVLASFTLAAQVPDPKKAEEYKKKITETDNDSLKVHYLVGVAGNLSFQDFKESTKYLDEAEKIATGKNWNWAKALVFSNRGTLADTRGDYSNSLEFGNKSLELDLHGGDSAAICTSYINVGNAYTELGQYEESYFYTQKAYQIADALNDTLSMAISMHNLAVLYSNLNRLDLALVHFKKAVELSAAANDDQGPTYNNHETGRAYLKAGDAKKALPLLMEALQGAKSLGLDDQLPKIYQSIAQSYSLSKDYKTCLLYSDSAITAYQMIGHEFGQAKSNLDKSRVYLAQGKFKEAAQLATTSLAKASALKAQVLEFECHKLLSECAEKQGDFKQALLHNKRAQQTRDSLTNVDMMSKVFENEFEMRSQRKDEQIANLNQQKEQSASEIKRQEFLRNIFAVVFALTIVLLYSVYRSGRRKVEMNDLLLQHQAEIEKRTQELEELNKVKDKFFSIISHDLRSPINSLAGLLDLMEKNEIKADELPSLTVEMRKQFNHTKNLINNLLDWTLLQMNKVSIKKEKIALKTLIDGNIKLLSSMSSKKTIFSNEVNESLTAFADQNMINLVFRNLILNGIKFTESNGTIKISAIQDDKQITVSVKDNGVGIAPEIQNVLFDKTTGYSTRGTANEKGTGLGLILCKEFVERNGGKIWLESELGKGSTFFVTIPVA